MLISSVKRAHGPLIKHTIDDLCRQDSACFSPFRNKYPTQFGLLAFVFTISLFRSEFCRKISPKNIDQFYGHDKSHERDFEFYRVKQKDISNLIFFAKFYEFCTPQRESNQKLKGNLICPSWFYFFLFCSWELCLMKKFEKEGFESCEIRLEDG